MAASCGRDASSCPVVVPSVFRQTLEDCCRAFNARKCGSADRATSKTRISKCRTTGTNMGSSTDKLRHPRSIAYSVELLLLNKHQISGGGACLHCYPVWVRVGPDGKCNHCNLHTITYSHHVSLERAAAAMTRKRQKKHILIDCIICSYSGNYVIITIVSVYTQ